jgi:hypothetical protein
MENLEEPDTLTNLDVLVMSYANMKPLKPSYHKKLIAWLKRGGYLIYCGEDNDPFQSIREWWNQGEFSYQAPSEHLFELAGIKPPPRTQTFEIGQGILTVVRKNPGEIAQSQDGGEVLRKYVRSAFYQKELEEKNSLHLQRGPYDIIAVMEESVNNHSSRIAGPVIDLYDPNLPILREYYARPGQRGLVYNLNRAPHEAPAVLAAASRISGESSSDNVYQFTCKGPAETNGILRLLAPNQPEKISAAIGKDNPVEITSDWDAFSKTVRIRYPNHPEGVKFTVTF